MVLFACTKNSQALAYIPQPPGWEHYPLAPGWKILTEADHVRNSARLCLREKLAGEALRAGCVIGIYRGELADLEVLREEFWSEWWGNWPLTPEQAAIVNAPENGEWRALEIQNAVLALDWLRHRYQQQEWPYVQSHWRQAPLHYQMELRHLLNALGLRPDGSPITLPGDPKRLPE